MHARASSGALTVMVPMVVLNVAAAAATVTVLLLVELLQQAYLNP